MSSRRPIAAIVRVVLRSLFLLVALLDVPDASAAQLTASWTDNSGGEAAFKIERRIASEATFTPLADVAMGVTTYVDGAITQGVTYCYRVKAYNDVGESPYCEEACGLAPLSDYSLTIASAGTGTGTVSSTPAGIDCGSSCTRSYSAGTLVTLAATAASGSRFDGWSGGCSGTAPCTVTGNAPVTVTARFTRLASPTPAPALPTPPAPALPTPAAPTPPPPTTSTVSAPPPTTPAPTTPTTRVPTSATPTTTTSTPSAPPTTTSTPSTPPTTTSTASTPATTTSTASTPTTTTSTAATATSMIAAGPTIVALAPPRWSAVVPNPGSPTAPLDYSNIATKTGDGAGTIVSRPTGIVGEISRTPASASDTWRPSPSDPDRAPAPRAAVDPMPLPPRRPAPEQTPARVAAPTSAVPTPARPWMTAVQSATTDIQSPYRLVVRVAKRTWIRVRMDNGQTTEEKLKAGSVRMWVSNRPFVITLGNVGGVRLELNGRRLPSPDGVLISDLMLPQDGGRP